MSRRILIVDDDDGVRFVMKRYLSDYEVLEASDGAAAHRIVCSTPVDLVVTDIIMPNQNGLEMILELRRVAPKLKLLAVSGGGWSMDAEECLHAADRFGADDILHKPFTREVLLGAVRRLLAEEPVASNL